MRRMIFILAAVLLLSGCGPVRLPQGFAQPSPSASPSLPPSPSSTPSPSPTATVTPTSTQTPTPSPTATPTGLPLFGDAVHLFRVLSITAVDGWERYGLTLERLSAREGQVYLAFEVDLVDGTNPIDLLPGPGPLDTLIYLEDERGKRYPAGQIVVTAANRARIMFGTLPAQYSGTLRLHFLQMPPVDILPGQMLTQLDQPSPPLALSGVAETPLPVSPAGPGLVSFGGYCPQGAAAVDLASMPAIKQNGLEAFAAGPLFRMVLAGPGQGLAAAQQPPGDGLLWIDARPVQPRSGITGLAFGLDERGSGYVFLADAAAQWSLVRALPGGKWQTVIPYTPSPALQTGGATNRLGVWQQGEWAALFANGIPVGSLLHLDDLHPAGAAGPALSAPDEQGLTAEFARFNHCDPGASFPLPVRLDGETRLQVPAGRPLLLEYTWTTNLPAQAESFAAKSSLRVLLDGKPLPDPLRYWGRAAPVGNIISSGERSAVRWQALLQPLAPGTHHLAVRLALLDQVTNGFDRDADRTPDRFGPGIILEQEIQIAVE